MNVAALLSFLVLSQAADDGAVLQTVREQVGQVLKAPASAKYEISGKLGKAEYPSGKVFRGSIYSINDALTRKGYTTVTGTYDSQNSFGVFLRGTWIALVRVENGVTKVGCVLVQHSDGDVNIAYNSKDFDSAFEEGLYTFLKDVFATYAAEVYVVEKATEKLPYNNPRRPTLYWGELNKRAQSIQSTFNITTGELERAFLAGVERGWTTKDTKHLEACKAMMRRQYKDAATALRRLRANQGMQQLNALVGSAVNAATRTAVSAPTPSHVNPFGR
jgi:hypothetical protein